MNVANSTPKPSDTAIGTMNAASRFRFHISGARTKKGGERRDQDQPEAVDARLPHRQREAGRLTMIRLSLTTTPVSATSPNIDIIDTLRSKRMCPQTAPMRPNGIAPHDDERLT